MIYLVSGKARSGKDTFANYLKKDLEDEGKKVCIIHIANSLKDMCFHYFDWDGKEEDKPRELLQTLGTDIIRVKLGKEKFFINRCLEDIEILNNFYDTFIIPDVRLPLEIEYIKEAYPDSIVIHIERDIPNNLNDNEKKHITETALDNYNDFDIKIKNTTLEALENNARVIVKENR